MSTPVRGPLLFCMFINTLHLTPHIHTYQVPHIGHLYSSVLADTLTRYYALKGADAFLCTGTDEHGLKVNVGLGGEGKKGMTVTRGSCLFRDKKRVYWLIMYVYIRRSNKQRQRTMCPLSNCATRFPKASR